MNENVRAAAVRRDESETLVGVEPLDGTFCHFPSSLLLGEPHQTPVAPGAAFTDLWLTSAKTIPEKRKRPPSILPRAFKIKLNTYEETTTATPGMLSAPRNPGKRAGSSRVFGWRAAPGNGGPSRPGPRLASGVVR
ncbi:hypothetical protein GCM10010151_11010 [Actinoallomurus spadix]|uniref:Uncharacterized protein n=1 Tax=Actinoallomurus spadix TaxID=79912 RepID=A0ABN0W1Y0_9ACTN